MGGIGVLVLGEKTKDLGKAKVVEWDADKKTWNGQVISNLS